MHTQSTHTHLSKRFADAFGYQPSLLSKESASAMRTISHGIQQRNSIPALNGFRPDPIANIIGINYFIERLFEDWDEICIFAVDAISFEYAAQRLFPLFQNSPYPTAAGILSSVFPSTTGTAWPSIIFGIPPSAHGIYGTSFFHEALRKNYVWMSHSTNTRGAKTAADTPPNFHLNLSGEQTIFEHMKLKGIDSHYIGNHGSSVHNPFRSELIRGAFHHAPELSEYQKLKTNPLTLLSFVQEQTTELLTANHGKILIWNYLDLDDFIHEQGYAAIPLEFWKYFIEFWSAHAAPKRLFLMISDHGQTVQEDVSIDIITLSANNQDLAYQTGDAGRVLYFYPKAGRAQAVRHWLESIIGDTGTVLEKEEVINLGLLERDPKGFSRIGDLVALATTPRFPATGSSYRYEHGSVTLDEMFVPILMQWSE